MSRNLAEDRCAKAGHLLAYVTMAEGQMTLSFRFPMHERHPDKIRRNLRDGQWQSIPAFAVEGPFQAFATCGCRKDHSLDLFDLLKRAEAGDVQPRVVRPV